MTTPIEGPRVRADDAEGLWSLAVTAWNERNDPLTRAESLHNLRKQLVRLSPEWETHD